MDLLQIRDITKKDIPLFYRNEYFADADFRVPPGKQISVKIDFVVEMSPLGEKIITVSVQGSPGYPTLPMIKLLKNEIGEMEKKGGLH